MSKETQAWLDNNIRVGFTAKRGLAWWSKSGKTTDGRPNHYEGPVPIEVVEKELFNFDVLPVPVYVMGAKGEYVEIPNRQAMACSDTFEVLGMFRGGYVGHQYREWLLQTVARILDDTLAIGAAGLLRNRAVAFVSVEVPENITTPEGVEFRPNLLATTSFDGSIATTYKRIVTNVVCDNTLAAGLREHGQELKIKHSRYSHLRITEAREALAVVHTIAEDFAAEVAALTRQPVSMRDFSLLLDAIVPVPETETGKGRAVTLAEAKREELTKLYRSDPRCAPWAGTAYGVLQTFNTYSQHVAPVRGAQRVERNYLNTIDGTTESQDADVLRALARVQA